MSTDRIYRANVYAYSNCAEVTGIREKNGFDVITTDVSVFYPEGGGQPSDTGTVRKGDLEFAVTRAYDESLESDVWHITDAPSGTFACGDKVVLSIDRQSRSTNMQRHLGEHMLSGTFHTLFGGVNKGFHMGQDYITIDIDLGGRMLTAEELEAAERHVNEAVWANLPVTVTYFDDYEASLSMPVRKQVPHEGRVSVVTVGDPADPYDCIACCGTHPANSAEVGLVAIYKSEPNKGMNRIYFDCGRSALAKLTSESHLLDEVSRRYSCSPADIISRLDAEAAHIASLKSRLAGLTSYVKESEKSRILGEIASSHPSSYVYSSDILSTDDLLKLGFSVINECDDMLLIMSHTETSTCLLFSSSDSIKCGQIVKASAPQFGGKGGGRDDNARALFSTAADMDAFICKVTGITDGE